MNDNFTNGLKHYPIKNPINHIQKYKIGIFFIMVLLLQSCASLSISQFNSLDAIIAVCDTQLQKIVSSKVPGAVVVFIKDGKIYYEKAFGYKNVKNQKIMTTNTIFQAASISKSITAFGIMKLVEDGKLQLDEPAETYLTRWHIPDSKYDKNEVTIRKLLSHSAGISEGGDPGYPPGLGIPLIEQSVSGNKGTRYWIYNNRAVKLIYKPGTQWQYSGGGYSILQLVTEEVTGNDFSYFMDQEVLKRMKMFNSSYSYNEVMGENSATPYSMFRAELPNYIFTEKAAAGLYTTSGDLANMIIELMKCYNEASNDFIISRETLHIMLEEEIGITENQKMGLGFFITELANGRKTYGHRGTNKGWRVCYEFSPDTKDGIIILTNGDNGYSAVIDSILSPWRNYVVNNR
jgi:CubicO group peptidase (beta-lactamase class C family)